MLIADRLVTDPSSTHGRVSVAAVVYLLPYYSLRFAVCLTWV
jgi:hypothetical protein